MEVALHFPWLCFLNFRKAMIDVAQVLVIENDISHFSILESFSPEVPANLHLENTQENAVRHINDPKNVDQYDCVILDVELTHDSTDASGLKILHNENLNDVPIIILSGFLDRHEVRANGMNPFMVINKPDHFYRGVCADGKIELENQNEKVKRLEFQDRLSQAIRAAQRTRRLGRADQTPVNRSARFEGASSAIIAGIASIVVAITTAGPLYVYQTSKIDSLTKSLEIERENGKKLELARQRLEKLKEWGVHDTFQLTKGENFSIVRGNLSIRLTEVTTEEVCYTLTITGTLKSPECVETNRSTGFFRIEGPWEYELTFRYSGTDTDTTEPIVQVTVWRRARDNI